MEEPSSQALGVAESGLFHALGAHLIWGAMPVYLILVREVPVVEFVAWRILFTLPLCLVIVAVTGAWSEMRTVIRDGRALLMLLGSAAMIAVNWTVYVWAIQAGHVYAASLGYYILPLVMMLLGLIVLGERLTRLQWWAISLAGAGVTALAAGALTTLWVSLALAASFGLYGLMRKTVRAGSLVGVAVESLVLAPFAAIVIAWHVISPPGIALGRDAAESIAIMLSGAITAVPLVLFATAARRMPYTVLGFLQFTAPTLVFLLGLFVFGERLRPAQLACFVAIWAAAGLFTLGLLRAGRPRESGGRSLPEGTASGVSGPEPR